ncbi:hypothetical protein B0H16DRAFT_1726461 [Mycena metata]|uniref:Uncharacterized protein n=1 Tax=Mycena metata TaxID=1033252 RepID=A0AAD7IM12_9AGAR|nr:hypothetical protein B0H16DRAFT_1726461 [Mycena metata]
MLIPLNTPIAEKMCLLSLTLVPLRHSPRTGMAYAYGGNLLHACILGRIAEIRYAVDTRPSARHTLIGEGTHTHTRLLPPWTRVGVLDADTLLCVIAPRSAQTSAPGGVRWELAARWYTGALEAGERILRRIAEIRYAVGTRPSARHTLAGEGTHTHTRLLPSLDPRRRVDGGIWPSHLPLRPGIDAASPQRRRHPPLRIMVQIMHELDSAADPRRNDEEEGLPPVRLDDIPHPGVPQAPGRLRLAYIGQLPRHPHPPCVRPDVGAGDGKKRARIPPNRGSYAICAPK